MYGDRKHISKSVVVWWQGDQRMGGNVGKGLQRKVMKLFAVMFIFLILDECICQTYNTVHFKYVQFIVYQLYTSTNL